MTEPTQAASLMWLHDVSGLTWVQIGRAFGVSQRAVHMWAVGGRISSSTAERVDELVGIVRKVQAEHPSDVRAALLAPRGGGVSVFDDFRARTRPDRDSDISGTRFTPGQLLGALHDRSR